MTKLMSLLALVLGAQIALADLVLYTDRPMQMTQPLADEFEARTGEKITIVMMGYDDIRARLIQEGSSTADLVFTKDLVYLADLEKLDVLQPLKSPEVLNAVEPFMQSPNQLWTAISMRARTIVYSPIMVNPSEVSSYADLADPKWQGRLCLRRSQDAYNVALIGFFIETMGYDAAKAMVQGWKNNLGGQPYSNDRAILDDIANGVCDVGVVNSYYLGMKMAENPAFPVGILFADQNGLGVHTNGTGIGITKASQNADLAEKFIALMLEENSQLFLAASHMDYPARKSLMPKTLVADWGSFLKAPVNWTTIGNRAEEAVQLANEVGY